MTISYTQLCRDARMCPSPSYYSGRGATLSDLDSTILETMYGLIESNVGKDNADQFVRMVASIEVMSATDFLITLERFVAQGFTWSDDSRTSGAKGIAVDNIGSGLATIAEVFGGLGGSKRDDTVSIRSIFLARHRDAVPVHKERSLHDMRRKYGYR